MLFRSDRIDGSASAPPSGATADKAAFGVLPHEEDLHNDLLVAKENTVARIAVAAPVIAESAPVLSVAPAPIAEEVKAAMAALQAANESVKEVVENPDGA